MYYIKHGERNTDVGFEVPMTWFLLRNFAGNMMVNKMDNWWYFNDIGKTYLKMKVMLF